MQEMFTGPQAPHDFPFATFDCGGDVYFLLHFPVTCTLLCVCVFRGLAAGEDNGQRGYMLTFVIAYLRVCYEAPYTDLFCLITPHFKRLKNAPS